MPCIVMLSAALRAGGDAGRRIALRVCLKSNFCASMAVQCLSSNLCYKHDTLSGLNLIETSVGQS